MAPSSFCGMQPDGARKRGAPTRPAHADALRASGKLRDWAMKAAEAEGCAYAFTAAAVAYRSAPASRLTVPKEESEDASPAETEFVPPATAIVDGFRV